MKNPRKTGGGRGAKTNGPPVQLRGPFVANCQGDRSNSSPVLRSGRSTAAAARGGTARGAARRGSAASVAAVAATLVAVTMAVVLFAAAAVAAGRAQPQLGAAAQPQLGASTGAAQVGAAQVGAAQPQVGAQQLLQQLRRWQWCLRQQLLHEPQQLGAGAQQVGAAQHIGWQPHDEPQQRACASAAIATTNSPATSSAGTRKRDFMTVLLNRKQGDRHVRCFARQTKCLWRIRVRNFIRQVCDALLKLRHAPPGKPR